MCIVLCIGSNDAAEKTKSKMTSSLVKITGNTYPVKDQLKAIGARWDADSKCWMIAADKADAARKIVAGSPATPARRRNFGAPISYRRLSDPRVQARMQAAWDRREERQERAAGIGI